MSISRDDAFEIIQRLRSESYIPADQTGVSDLRVISLHDAELAVDQQCEYPLIDA